MGEMISMSDGKGNTFKVPKDQVEIVQSSQHACAMTDVINDIKAEQVEQKISLVTLISEVTRLASAVSDLVDTQKNEEKYKLSQKDKKIDGFVDILKSISLLLAGFLLSQL